MRFFIDVIFLTLYLVLGIPVLLILILIGKMKNGNIKVT